MIVVKALYRSDKFHWSNAVPPVVPKCALFTENLSFLIHRKSKKVLKMTCLPFSDCLWSLEFHHYLCFLIILKVRNEITVKPQQLFSLPLPLPRFSGRHYYGSKSQIRDSKSPICVYIYIYVFKHLICHGNNNNFHLVS